MKIAVFADIHSNLPALEMVLDDLSRWRPDLILVGGDIINRGPNPYACTKVVLEEGNKKNWGIIRGNHERFVLDIANAPCPPNGPDYEISMHARWTLQKLEKFIKPLGALPDKWQFKDKFNNELRLVHASMLGDRKGIFPDDTDEQLNHKIAPAPEVLLCGHTHRPLIRKIDKTLIVNVGAVGVPMDLDPRASYLQLTQNQGQWTAKIIRLNYDREKAIKDFYNTDYLEKSGEFGRLILLEFLESRSLIPGWYRSYEQPVLQNKLDLKTSIDLYLNSLGIRG